MESNLVNLKEGLQIPNSNNETFFSSNSNLSQSKFQNNIIFLSLNIRGINDLAKSIFLKDLLDQMKVSICFLQETHLDSVNRIEELEILFSNYFCFFSTYKIKTRGVAILISKKLENLKILSKFYDIESRFVSIDLEFSNKKYTFLNIYAPNLESEHFPFINSLYNICSAAKLIFIAGDFNSVTKVKDRFNPNNSEKKLKNCENEWIKFFKNFRLKEISYGITLSNEQKMTWSNNGFSSRIDRIYVTCSLADKASYTSIFETARSDHKAIFASLHFFHTQESAKKYIIPGSLMTLFWMILKLLMCHA